MRRNDTLMEMEDIVILCQFLYMSEDHYITVDNGMTKLEIRMNDKTYFHAKNLKFPDLPDLNYTDMMNIPNMFGIIGQLKKTAAVEFPNSFKNRWEEIKSITSTTIAQNKMMMKR